MIAFVGAPSGHGRGTDVGTGTHVVEAHGIVGGGHFVAPHGTVGGTIVVLGAGRVGGGNGQGSTDAPAAPSG